MPNLVPFNSAYIDQDIGDWIPEFSCSLAWSASDPDEGAGHMVMTTTAAFGARLTNTNHPGWLCSPVAGSTYTASIRAKTDSTSTAMIVDIEWWRVGDASELDIMNINGDAGTGSYATLSNTGTIPDGANALWVQIYAASGYTVGDTYSIDTVVVDAALMEPGRASNAYRLGR